jgi:sugar lactone lactonase YvrE
MTFGRGRLWVLRPRQSEVVAVSPDSGKVLQTVKLPVAGAVGVGWWDGKLAVTKNKPNEVVQIDPDTGKIARRLATGDIPEEPSGIAQVGKKLWLVDGWQWIVHAVDPAEPEKAEHILLGAAAARTDVAFAGDGVWHHAWHALVKTDINAPPVQWGDEATGLTRNNGPVLDWAEVPIGCSVAGLAWDGKRLWMLDRRRSRICLIEKSGATK